MGASESQVSRTSPCPLSREDCHLCLRNGSSATPEKRFVEEDALDEFSRLLKRRSSSHPRRAGRQSSPKRPECREISKDSASSAGWWTQSGFGKEGQMRALAFQQEAQRDLASMPQRSDLSARRNPEGKGMLTIIFDDADKRQELTRKTQEDGLLEYLRSPTSAPKETVDQRKAVLQDVTHEYFFDRYFFDRPMTPKSPHRPKTPMHLSVQESR
eukprot:GEMP01054934.1.p1 GENE.GEMP01054934.1~~GEMP01054934.1.p1  ORF type:complete len:234 (+),score=21.68 GEMP01054934.1:63-704(+)